MNVLTPTVNQVPRSKHLHIPCLRSSVPALAVPCSPMPMVISVCQMAAFQVCSHTAGVCLVDHVLHGNCPDVITFGEPTKNGGLLLQGGNDKQGVMKQGVSTLLGDKRAHCWDA